MPEIILNNIVTIESVRKAKPKHIWYAARTCWWTHDPNDLAVSKDRYRIPLDPRSSVLYWTEDYEGFFKAAEDNAAHYGKHGLRAFVAAHHKNCRMKHKGLEGGWSFVEWSEYNDLLDYLDKHKVSSVEAYKLFPEAEWLQIFK